MSIADESIYVVVHYTKYGGITSFETNDDWRGIADTYENMWDYVEVKNHDGKILYETNGLKEFKERMGYK